LCVGAIRRRHYNQTARQCQRRVAWFRRHCTRGFEQTAKLFPPAGISLAWPKFRDSNRKIWCCQRVLTHYLV
jgi:hypothetical protein